MSKPQHLKTTKDFIDETITASQLIAMLKKFPKDTKIFISSDSEGNGFGTIDKSHSWGYSAIDNALAIYQFADHLQDEDIQPLQHKQIMRELEEEANQRALKHEGDTNNA